MGWAISRIHWPSAMLISTNADAAIRGLGKIDQETIGIISSGNCVDQKSAK